MRCAAGSFWDDVLLLLEDAASAGVGDEDASLTVPGEG